MTHRSGVWRALALGLLVILLLASAYNGLVEGLNAIHYADTPGMQVATVTRLSLTAGLAPVVYGAQPLRTGVLTGLASALLFGLVVWAWRKTSRSP